MCITGLHIGAVGNLFAGLWERPVLFHGLWMGFPSAERPVMHISMAQFFSFSDKGLGYPSKRFFIFGQGTWKWENPQVWLHLLCLLPYLFQSSQTIPCILREDELWYIWEVRYGLNDFERSRREMGRVPTMDKLLLRCRAHPRRCENGDGMVDTQGCEKADWW